MEKQTIAVAATFTAEPVEESLAFWLRHLGMPAAIAFAPYNQVTQQLLDPTSIFATNAQGLNVVLVRPEDWLRFAGGIPAEGDKRAAAEERIRQGADELIDALASAASGSRTPYLLVLCPPSPELAGDAGWARLLGETEERVAGQLQGQSGVTVVTSAEMAAAYPAADTHDARSDELGHVPYTPAFFAAVGTMVARKLHALRGAPYKVVVADCDNTLWCGVCGEVGAEGVSIEGGHWALQEALVRQHDAGMLLCLASKNSEDDVFQVFERRPEMPLKREHLVAWRVNWQPKSQSLREMAEDLQLGLDSFVFLDDNPVECAEVAANCPEVLVIRIPEDPDRIPHLLSHVWAFDHLKVTEQDRQRTVGYRQNLERERVRREARTLSDFLSDLQLHVGFAEPGPEQLARVAQLTQRTNQFNFTTIRRAEEEIRQLCASGELECLTVEVNDRFGDYGLVGAILFRTTSDALEVDTFLLSCRVLARGVEHRMLARLGEMAVGRDLARVDVPFLPTAKNTPARAFLEGAANAFRSPLGEGFVFRVPADFAAKVTISADGAPAGVVAESATPASPSASAPAGSAVERAAALGRIATELNEPEQVLRALSGERRTRGDGGQAYEAPRTPAEERLAAIWADLLRVDRAGIHDGFWELGGDSLLAVRLFAEIEKAFGKALPLSTLFEGATIAYLAGVLTGESPQQAWRSLVPIQPHGSRPRLFCVHEGDGNVLLFRGLAHHLGGDQPVYGLQSENLDGSRARTLRLEEIAGRYIEEIRALQPQGPYYLSGFCFGGVLAYEMAQQLRRDGHEVPLVALFSAPNPSSVYACRPTHGAAGGEAILRKRGFSNRVGSVAAEVAGAHRSIPRWAARLRRGVIWRLCEAYLVTGPPLPARARHFYLRELARRSQEAYSPATYPGRVVLLRTRSNAKDPTWGWGVVAPRLEVCEIAAPHQSVLNESVVQDVARRLAALLAEGADGRVADA